MLVCYSKKVANFEPICVRRNIKLAVTLLIIKHLSRKTLNFTTNLQMNVSYFSKYQCCPADIKEVHFRHFLTQSRRFLILLPSS